MTSASKLKNFSFLVYGLGKTGRSVVKFFKKNNIKNFQVWDDKNKNLYKSKRAFNLDKSLRDVSFIVLSPGVSLKNTQNKNKLRLFKDKIITDIDLIYLLKKFYKSIVVTGTNGKSTTCKIIQHVLKNNKFKTLLGGNIGVPILSLDIKKNHFLIIEASSYQLSHSKFIKPDYALLLNITNDHLDWHGNMKNYISSKLKIFDLQNGDQYALLNKKFKNIFKKRNFLAKLIIPETKNYKQKKTHIQNPYAKLDINDENISFVFALSKLLRIKESSFFKSLDSFKGLPHRYEIFLKRKNCLFINDSKATSFQASKFALKNSTNIYWIVGGLPKKNDKFFLQKLKKNIIKSYIIGKKVSFFKKQIYRKTRFFIAKNLKKSLEQISKDIKFFKKKNNTILFSPAAASFDQFLNFEKRGETFKKLCKLYARRFS